MNLIIRNFQFLFLIQTISLYLFKEGFLLTRLELDNKSQHTLPTFTTRQRFNKTILVMIDALRYDFMKWDESSEKTRNLPHYLNKLDILHQLQKKEPLNSLLLRGLSDPPTTTLQRLMAIMTGALPTLIDAGSNFASSALKEDNLIEKIIGSGKRVVSLGDDTWDRLFPSSINESYFYPSFDVWDLHSVDLGVLEHLIPMLDSKEHDWGFLIAHFLGVDHAGHRYGPGHVAMGDKLVQMNKVLTEIFEKSHPDTLVIVMGDHGMDKKGDHGGDSFQEMNAGLFFYSKTPFLAPSYHQNLQIALKGVLELDREYDIFTEMKGDRTVQQIDLVPTLSALMGLGIPFGNLGTIIPEFFITKNGYGMLLDEMKRNAKQVADYLDVYTLQRTDAKSAFEASRIVYQNAVKAHLELSSEMGTLSETDLREKELQVFLAYTKFMRQTLLVARSIWSRFEHSLMAMGSIGLFLALFIALRMFSFDEISSRDLRKIVLATLVGGLFGSSSPIRRIAYSNVTDLGTITLQKRHEILFFAIFFLALTWIVYSKKSKLDINLSNVGGKSEINHTYLLRISTLLILLYTCTLGSDSFLIFEDFVLLHFCQLIHFLMTANAYLVSSKENFQSYKEVLKGIICMVITRIISLVTICRPDQGPYCVPSYNDTPTSSISALWTLVPSLGLCICICIFVWSKQSYRFSILFTLNIISVQAYWMIETLDNHFIKIFPAILENKNWFAYTFWVLLVLLLLSQPLSRDTLLEIGFGVLIMFQKPMGCIILALFYIYLILMRNAICAPQSFFFMGQLTFFATGHQNILATIQHDMGFIGLVNADMTLSPIFIALNTFAGPILGSLGVATSNRFSLSILVKYHGIIWARHLAMTVFFTWYFCRHSQAFRVWGPKFLFFASSHVFSAISFFCSLVIRIRNRDVEPGKLKTL